MISSVDQGSDGTRAEKPRNAASPPASVSAFSTAVMMARLVYVAPVTTSMPVLWCSTICAGIDVRAPSLRLNVSPSSTMETESMELSPSTTSTTTPLWCPWTVWL